MPMKAICRAIALALFLAPAASFAVKVPIPIDGATLNVSIQIQTQIQINQNGAPAGNDPSYDLYMRRTRLLVNGDASQNFTYLLQIDNANFGKFGNFAPRAIIQDAWVGWAPGGITGGTVVYLDAGILLIPISHHLLESTTNFIAADVQTDGFRFLGNNFQGLRDPGVQLRGWLFNKKVGFRGGVYEGNTPATAIIGGAPANINSTVTAGNQCTAVAGAVAVGTGTSPQCLAPKRYPMVGGYIGFDIIGSEEGGWLYGAYKWGKDPILSVGVADNYQALSVRNFGSNNLNDQNIFAANYYLNLPLGGDWGELVSEGTVYLNNNGTNNANTGTGAMLDVGVRLGTVAPYIALDYFSAKDCDTTAAGVTGSVANTAACVAGTAANTPHSADTREAKIGIAYFFNKNLNHMNLEFIESHGTSTYGAGAITAGNAGYAPLVFDPATPTGQRRGFNGNLRNPALWTVLYHWNFFF